MVAAIFDSRWKTVCASEEELEISEYLDIHLEESQRNYKPGFRAFLRNPDYISADADMLHKSLSGSSVVIREPDEACPRGCCLRTMRQLPHMYLAGATMPLSCADEGEMSPVGSI